MVFTWLHIFFHAFHVIFRLQFCAINGRLPVACNAFPFVFRHELAMKVWPVETIDHRFFLALGNCRITKCKVHAYIGGPIYIWTFSRLLDERIHRWTVHAVIPNYTITCRQVLRVNVGSNEYDDVNWRFNDAFVVLIMCH